MSVWRKGSPASRHRFKAMSRPQHHEAAKAAIKDRIRSSQPSRAMLCGGSAARQPRQAGRQQATRPPAGKTPLPPPNTATTNPPEPAPLERRGGALLACWAGADVPWHADSAPLRDAGVNACSRSNNTYEKSRFMISPNLLSAFILKFVPVPSLIEVQLYDPKQTSLVSGVGIRH